MGSDRVMRVAFAVFPGVRELEKKEAQLGSPRASDTCWRRRGWRPGSTLDFVCSNAGLRRAARRFTFRKPILKGFLKRHQAFQRVPACRPVLVCCLIPIVVWFGCMHCDASSRPIRIHLMAFAHRFVLRLGWLRRAPKIQPRVLPAGFFINSEALRHRPVAFPGAIYRTAIYDCPE